MTPPAYNIILGWPIRSDISISYTPTLSGGSWLAGLPLTNLQEEKLRLVARSTDVATGSTTFEVDLKTARDIRVIAIPYHTLSLAATIRIRGGSVAGLGSGVLYDSGVVNVYAAGITAENTYGLNVGYTLPLPATVTAQYWKVDIDDSANARGYIDVGRIIIADGWQPTLNMTNGATQTIEDLSSADQTPGGAEIYTRRKKRRVTRFAIEDLLIDEMMTKGFDMMRLAGTTEQIHLVFDPTDTIHMHRRSYTGRLRTLNALEYVSYLRHNTAFEHAEVL